MKNKLSIFVREDIKDGDYIKSFKYLLNPQDNGGEAIFLVVDLYNNGDDGPEGYWTATSLETNCYGVSGTTIRTFIPIEQLKEAVDKIYEEKLRSEIPQGLENES